MSEQFLLPDLGEGLTEAEILTWLVAEGDVIAVDQPVVEVESAKSVVELPSPYGGRVTALHAAPGQSLEMGAPLLTVEPEEAGTARSADDGPQHGAAAQADPPTTGSPEELVPGTALREEPAEGSGAVLVGYGTREPTVRLKRPEGGRFGGRTAAGGAATALDRTDEDSRTGATPPREPAVTSGPATLLDPKRRSPVLSPIVRQLARAHGFDASQLIGSGSNNVVRRDDVDAAIRALAQEHAGREKPVEQTSVPAAVALVPPERGGSRIPITGLRKLVGTRLVHSRQVVPDATIWLDVDATGLFAAKQRLEQATGERFGLTALIARFVVAGLARYPVLNSSVDDERQEIVQHGAVHLGLAAQTARGLMVPVVHDADTMTTRALRDAVGALVSRADQGDYAADEVSGSTFTLNNYGGFGVDGSAPIINHPEVAMLGVGRVLDRPWVVDGELAVRKVVLLSFVFDHRVCDGDVAAGFLTFVAKAIEEPVLLLADL